MASSKTLFDDFLGLNDNTPNDDIKNTTLLYNDYILDLKSIQCVIKSKCGEYIEVDCEEFEEENLSQVFELKFDRIFIQENTQKPRVYFSFSYEEVSLARTPEDVIKKQEKTIEEMKLVIQEQTTKINQLSSIIDLFDFAQMDNLRKYFQYGGLMPVRSFINTKTNKIYVDMYNHYDINNYYHYNSIIDMSKINTPVKYIMDNVKNFPFIEFVFRCNQAKDHTSRSHFDIFLIFMETKFSIFMIDITKDGVNEWSKFNILFKTKINNIYNKKILLVYPDNTKLNDGSGYDLKTRIQENIAKDIDKLQPMLKENNIEILFVDNWCEF